MARGTFTMTDGPNIGGRAGNQGTSGRFDFVNAGADAATANEIISTQDFAIGPGWRSLFATLTITEQGGANVAGDNLALTVGGLFDGIEYQWASSLVLTGNLAAPVMIGLLYDRHNAVTGQAGAPIFNQYGVLLANSNTAIAGTSSRPYLPILAADGIRCVLIASDAAGGDSLFTGFVKLRFF